MVCILRLFSLRSKCVCVFVKIMDEKLEQKLLKWYEECTSESESEHDPYSTDEDPDFELNVSDMDQGSSDSENCTTYVANQG